MRRIRRGLLKRCDDDPLNVGVGDRARRTGTRIITQPVETPGYETPTPFPDRRGMHPDQVSNVVVGRTIGTRQHDPAS